MNLPSDVMIPFFAGLAIAVVLFSIPMFGHIQFKHINIKKINIISAIFAIPFVIFYMNFLDFMTAYASLFLIHISFLGVFFILYTLMQIIRFKNRPSLIQIVGLGVFLSGFVFLLA